MLRNLYLLLYYLIIKKIPSSYLPGGLFFAKVRRKTLSQFMSIGEGTVIQQNVYVGNGDNVKIGSYCVINENVKLRYTEIGDYVLIAPGVSVIGVNHVSDRIDIPIALQGDYKDKIVIEENVWIGTNAIITAGVKVEKGCIIGAGAVVTHDCHAFGVYGGVPARLIRYRNENC